MENKPAAAQVAKVDSRQMTIAAAIVASVGSIVTIVGFMFMFIMNLGDKIADDIKASEAEMKASIVVLAGKVDNIEKRSTNTYASIAKLEANFEKLSTKTDASIAKLESNFEKRSTSIEKLSTKTDASIAKLD